jgi:hypothetical protein
MTSKMQGSLRGRNAGLRALAWMSMAGMLSVAAAGPRYNVADVVRITDDGAGGLVVEGTLGQVRNSSNDALTTQQQAEVLQKYAVAVNQGRIVPETARLPF